MFLKCRIVAVTIIHISSFLAFQDLQKMKIGTEHRNQIWRSLVEFRNSNMFVGGATPTSPSAAGAGAGVGAFGRTHSNASTVSMLSQQGGGGAAGPGATFEVTRYTFKHTISASQDHDYHI